VEGNVAKPEVNLDVNIHVHVKNLTIWDAIKIRIAGSPLSIIVDKIKEVLDHKETT
jgi:hypothetical protein